MSPEGTAPSGQPEAAGNLSPVPINLPTVLLSALLAALVAVVTASAVARRKASADRDVAARVAIRAAVRPIRREVAQWAREGLYERDPDAPSAADAEAVSAVLESLPDLPAWRRWAVRRRLRHLFGSFWVSHLELFPYDAADPMNSLIRATAREHRAGAEGQLLTAGLVHRTLSPNEIDDRKGRQLDRQLRRLEDSR